MISIICGKDKTTTKKPSSSIQRTDWWLPEHGGGMWAKHTNCQLKDKYSMGM